MGYKVNNVVDTEGFPFYLVDELRKSVNVSTIIELGTAGAASTKQMAKVFERVVTIELIEGRNNADLSLTNVQWLEGDTVALLPNIIDNLISEEMGMQSGDSKTYNYTIFFIDSHYSDEKPNESEYPECPLLQELEIISKYNQSAIIIIDDLRLFLGQVPYPLEPKEWCSIADIFALLKEKYPYNTSTVIDDYILSYPERLDEPFDKSWRDNFTKRYPSADAILKQQTKEVFKAFKNYIK